MKKIVSLVLVAMMLLSGIAFAEEKVQLTAIQWALDNQSAADFNEMWYFQQIEEKTGVDVEFRMVGDDVWSTQLYLMFATPKNMEDIIIRGSVDVEEYGVTQGLLLPLDEYLTEEIMPNYMSRINLNNAGDSIPASDGKSYYIGYLIAQNVNHNSTWYINPELLKQVGKEVPTTIEEYTEVLRAFKAAGVKYPYSASNSDFGAEHMWAQFSSFGVPLQMYTFATIGDDGKVIYIGDQPGFRAACEWLAMLYAEGLMDPESLTQDSNVWANKVNAGEVGSFNYLRLINTALTNPDTIQHFESMLPPASEYGTAVPQIMEIPEQGAYLTSTNNDPVASLKWLDAQLETEMMMTASNGKMGEQMIINDAGKYEIINVPENNGLYSFVPVAMGQFFAPGEYYTEVYQMAPHRVERYEDSQWYAAEGVLEKTSYEYLTKLSKMSNEDATELNLIKTDLEKYIKEAIVGFIKNGVTDKFWNEFIETSKGIGSDRYVELYQNAYDAYLAK